MGKKFFYVCAGLFLLVLAYQLGATGAQAQSGQFQLAGESPAVCGVSGRVLTVIRRDGSNQPLTFPDPIPGSSPVIGIWAETTNSLDADAIAVLADGEVLQGSYGRPWITVSNLLAAGQTSVTGATWGQVKSTYRK